MAGDCPVDDLNLSFSGDKGKNLFITQSTFRDVTTQEADDAADFFMDFGDIIVSDTNECERRDLEKLAVEAQNDMCQKIFDFSNDVDNGWKVSTQENPIIVTRKSDGEQFVVGSSGTSDYPEGDESKDVQLKQFDKDLDADLK